jgi:glutamyl-tRNA reductase
VESFISHARAMDVTPTIVSLRQHWESVRKEELARNKKRLGALSQEQEAAIENLTQSLMNKVLHGPIAELKSLSRDPAGSRHIESIRRMLGLKE